MQNYMKTILSALQTWTQKKIKDSTADWNENDSSKSSYIKNRTHWEEQDGTIHKLDKKYLDLPDNLTTLDDLYSYTKKEIDSPKDYIMLNDISDGLQYKIQIKDGNIVSTVAGSLEDFDYTTNSDGTYTIIGWKQTYFGEPSTIMVIPDDSNIIL